MDSSADDESLHAMLAARLGAEQARRRLELEITEQTPVFGGGVNFFHPENWLSLPALIRASLTLVGMHRRAQRNATQLALRTNDVPLAGLAPAFDGFTLLHLSDLHVDINDTIVGHIVERIAPLAYDVCVLTGDYRAATRGPIDAALDGMRRICAALRRPIYAVFGNHDSVRMLPQLEAMGIRMLMNESVQIRRDAATVHLAGVDDPHFFRADDIARAAAGRRPEWRSILLSHTPEIYAAAAAAGFDLMLSGHTHGGQICLPGGIPLTLDARLPRRFGRGAWQHGAMQGYTSAGCGTSIVDVRLNCPPEVTLHRLRRA